jgi:predicted transposase YdaD
MFQVEVLIVQRGSWHGILKVHVRELYIHMTLRHDRNKLTLLQVSIIYMNRLEELDKVKHYHPSLEGEKWNTSFK